MSNPNIAQPTATAPGTYTVTVTNTANSCTNTDAVTIFQDITSPTANAGPNQTLTCSATSFVIGTTAVAGNTYTWSPSIGLSNANIAQPTATAAGTYTVTVTNTANGCTANDAVTITQNITPPTANAGADKILTCTATSFVIGTAAVAGNTYAWSPTLGLSNAGIAQPTATAAGTYTITVTNTANGCTANDAVTITQNITPPTANAGADKTLTCTTTSFVIGSVAVAGNTYAWSPTLGLSNAGIAQTTATAAGTYTVTVTNTANGCTANDAVTITQNITPPTANAGADKTLTCSTTSFVIGSVAVAGNTYAWSPSLGLSNAGIAQPTATAAGTYTVTVTNTANGCTANDVVIITKNITPPIANAGTDKLLTCTATSFVIGTPLVAGNTYSWSPAAGLSATNIAQPTATAPGTYTVTVTNTTNGCTANDAVTITQNITPPTANAGTDKLLTCTATSFVIGTPLVAGNTYSWSPAAGLSATNIAQPTATAPGTYTLTVTNTTNGCTATDAVIVSQNISQPIANAGADKLLTCTATSFVIGTAAVAGNTYSWSPAAGLSATNIAQPTATAPRTYTVTVTNTANGCTANDAVTITQNITPPTANAGADKILTCTATSFVIGTAAVAGNTYAWSPTLGLSNAGIAQPTATAAGTYTITVTNTANGCTANDAVTITQNITPPTANAGADKTLTCTTTSFVIGSVAVAGNTYAWSPTLGLSNAGIAQTTATAAGTYTVTVTNTANGCTANDAVTITQNITPPTANAGADKTLTCSTTSFVIGSVAVAGNTYAWSPSLGLSNAGIAQPTATAAGTYTVTVTNTANGCTANDVVIITKNITPPIANAGTDKLLTCTATSFVIGTPLVAGNTYSWSPAAGLSATNIAQPTATAPGTYTVTVTNTTNGCTANDAVTITQNITPPTANAGTDKLLTCTATSFVIGTPLVAGNTYSWSPAAGLSATNIAQPTATAPGTYTLTVTNTTNGCTATDAVIVSQNISQPIANAGADKLLTCTATSFVIGTAAVAGNTYTWSPAAGLSATNIAQPTATAPRTYTVTVTNTANGCTANDAVTITQNITPPTANAGADKILTCTATSFVIGTAAVAGNTYAWSPTLGLSNAGIAQPTATAAGTYTITVTNTANGCTANDAVTITQNITPPTANAGADKTLTCTTTSFVIGSVAVAGNTYAWSPTLGLSNAGIAQTTATAAGTYTVTVTNTANGCTANDAVTITQNITPPTANAGADKTLTCSTTSFVIGSVAVAGNTYAWSPSLGLSNAGIAQPTATAAGTYTVTVTNTANGCTANDVVIITKNITPPIANAGTDKLLTCTATSFVIGTPLVAGNTYSWSPAAGLSATNIAQPTATALGTYTVTVTNTANGCTANDAVIILQDVSLPIANAGADKVITCSNPTHLIGSAAIAGNTYAWSPSLGLLNASIAQPTATAPGTYTVTVTKISDGCTLTDAVTITQNTTAPPVNAGTDQTLTCTTTSFKIGTTAVVGNTYSWSPTLGLSNANIAQPTITAPNTYTLTVTNILNGCTSTDAVNILQNITPPTANAGADKIITCSNPTHVIGTPAIAGNMYSWSPNIGLSNASIAIPTANTTGNYTLTVTQLSNGCTSTDAVLVSVDTTRPLANAGADIILTCSNPTKLIGTTAIVGNTYSWSPSAGLNNANIAQPIASNTGTYTVTVTKTSNGCTKSDAVISTRDTSYPVANAGIDQILTCTKTSSIIGTSGVGGNTYSWSPSLGLNNAGIAQPRADSTGTFTLTVTKTSNGCQSTDAVTIARDTVRPIADAGDSTIFDCPHIPITLGTAEVPGFSYHWTNVNGISATNIAQPTTDTAGSFVLIVTNDFNGCVSKPDTIKVKWKNCECEFLVPSAFTPNNDGTNDVLRPLRFCDDYSDIEFSVFNRWGALVYKSNDIIEGWNGFLRSEEQQVDSYIWTLSYYDILNKEKIFKKGTVTLLR